MKLYRIPITPTSDFITKLKGDTLFGQICWAIFYRFGQERLGRVLEAYAREEQRPFLVVSDAFPSGYLPKPKMPSRLLKEKSEEKKLNRKKIWLTFQELLNGAYTKAKSDKEIENIDRNDVTIHNALNYKTFHTGEGFDPHALAISHIGKKDVYVLLDESQLGFNDFVEVFALLGSMGYGKKATIGKGRFSFQKEEIQAIEVEKRSKVFMTLSPFSPKGVGTDTMFYEPFTRFGKFGGERAYKNAFKKPILLADTASVAAFDEVQEHQYLGRAITGLSDIPEYSDTVHQGYSIVLPLKELR